MTREALVDELLKLPPGELKQVLVRNHPFFDGNKRTPFITAAVVLKALP